MNVFVYAQQASFPHFDPASSFSNDLIVMANCYEGLTFYNPPGSDEILSPSLATSWEASEDATEWTFKLREGVTFHNGDPFNAEAVKEAIAKTMEIGEGAAFIWDPVEEMEVVDDYTITFKLSYPAALDLIASSGYAAWIYNPQVYEQEGRDWFASGHCVGTGPYTIESYEPNSRLVMTRYDDYWGGWHEGQFDKVVYEIREDAVVRQQMIEAGTASWTNLVPPENLPSLQQRDDLKVVINPSFQNLFGFLNTKKPPLDSKLVRQALSYSVPYSDFITVIMGDRATQARGPIPQGMWGHDEVLFQYTHDLDKARELLAEAGYPDGGFELLYTFLTGDLEEQQMGELWKAELAKLGIDMKLQGMDWVAQWELSTSDPTVAQDVFVMYWWPTYVHPNDQLYSMFRSEEEPLFNLGYYSNSEFDQLIDEANALSGSDREKAAELYVQAQEMLVEDAPAIFFYDLANVHLIRSDIRGYVDNPAYPHVVYIYQLTK
jgi:peptide/nickel transport system substrate-binding protein